MITRVWTILGAIALVAFVIGALLGGFSLILYRFGAFRGQLMVAGVARMLVSIVFLIAGAAILYVVSRIAQKKSEPRVGRLVFAAVATIAGACWLIIGIRGIVSPELLRTAFGQN